MGKSLPPKKNTKQTAMIWRCEKYLSPSHLLTTTTLYVTVGTIEAFKALQFLKEKKCIIGMQALFLNRRKTQEKSFKPRHTKM